jgi:hypothetical protein
MTREEKLEKYLDHQYMYENGDPSYIQGIKVGVSWADKNPKSPWISVEDKLPEEHTDVIVTDGSNVAHCKKYGDGFYTNVGKCCNVTHWMQIPELPKEEKK